MIRHAWNMYFEVSGVSKLKLDGMWDKLTVRDKSNVNSLLKDFSLTNNNKTIKNSIDTR